MNYTFTRAFIDDYMNLCKVDQEAADEMLYKEVVKQNELLDYTVMKTKLFKVYSVNHYDKA